MKFPLMFTRFKPAVAPQIALGADTVPNFGVPPDASKDNLLAVRVTSINGWPPHRVAVICRFTGAAAPPGVVSCQLFFYESSTQAWYACGPAQNIQPSTQAGAANAKPIFFDMVVPVDFPNVKQATDSMPGNAQFVLITNAGVDDGRYDFALAVDLTTG